MKNNSHLYIPLLGAFLSFSGLGAVNQPAVAPRNTPAVYAGSLPLAASARPAVVPPVWKGGLSRGVDTTASTVLVVDVASGTKLYAVGEEKVTPLASLTKLMTALVLNDVIDDWSKKVTFTKEDRTLGNLPHLYPGDIQTRDQLFNIALIPSDNDAIMSLVRSSGLTNDEFVKKMNEKADRLGLKKTVFVDPTGLNPGNLSTAVELSRILTEAMKIDRIKKATISRSYQVRTKRQHIVRNTNLLLDSYLNKSPYQIVGGKTGFIEESGYNLAMQLKNGNADLYTIVMGSRTNSDRFQDTKSVVGWVVDNFIWPNSGVAGF